MLTLKGFNTQYDAWVYITNSLQILPLFRGGVNTLLRPSSLSTRREWKYGWLKEYLATLTSHTYKVTTESRNTVSSLNLVQCVPNILINHLPLWFTDQSLVCTFYWLCASIFPVFVGYFLFLQTQTFIQTRPTVNSNPISRHIVHKRYSSMNRVPEHDFLTFFVLHDEM